VQVRQGQPGAGGRGRFDGRPNVSPQADVQQQAYGNRGPLQVERNRNGGWTRTNGYRGGETDQQRVRSGSWYGQRGGMQQQQQYHNGTSYAGNSWNRNWRNDRRYDWHRYRDNHRSVFHLGLYIDPFGYGYQPYSIGYELPPIYFGQQYWIDPGMYELPYPPPGTQWVRYWNDALLVDVYSGQIVDVIQGFFL
jgi:Ni/Co efflux regulator RcnB